MVDCSGRPLSALVGATIAAFVCIASPLRATVAEAQQRILLVGDSIMYGSGIDSGQLGLESRLERSLTGVHVYNLSGPGVSASYFYDMATAGIAYHRGVFGTGVRAIVIGLGRNDFGMGLSLNGFATAYAKILRSVSTVPLVACVGPTWSKDEQRVNQEGKTIQDYRDKIRELCDKPAENRFYWDGREATPHDLGYFVDGIHPNKRGYRAYARWLSEQLREVLPPTG